MLDRGTGRAQEVLVVKTDPVIACIGEEAHTPTQDARETERLTPARRGGDGVGGSKGLPVPGAQHVFKNLWVCLVYSFWRPFVFLQGPLFPWDFGVFLINF